ncbi:deleted in malignant brain tumors 1 protein-like isoform X2 [Mercenaria mercenaria]|uniref:deleted in malignant brain tumors 1 protein-like isoform X2 n=1 Tax=Mercenaria mercenaria TaxID=6596 RepID=UPI00234F640B|nr:deleted in malignant brain tumors 1 protein-like isoform X2 [Mercenaria mercenaria]
MAKIGLNLFFILSVSCLASKAFGKASAESLYESLSWRIDYVIRDVNNLRSELMETKSVVNRLESKIEKIEENATATIIGTNKNEEKISQSIINDKIKAVEERTESLIKNQIKRQKVAVMKILFENKKLMREKVQNFESKFIMFTSDIKFQMELMNASMESSVESLEQSMTEHKIDTNSSLMLMNASIKNSVESLEQSMNEHKIDTNSSLMLMNADSHDRLNETNLKLEVMRVEFQNMKDDSDTKIEMTKNEIENKMNSVLQNATSGINDRLNDAESRIRSMSSENQEVVNGRWSPWSSWSSCSVTCGVGMKERTRRCDNPAPSRLGQACIGSSEDKEICTMNKCPFSVRLVNGPHAFEGRLEVYNDGQWGTVCDDFFDNDAAKVVCRMLDFPGDVNLAEKYSAAHYGRGSLPILLDDVSCNGSELSITDCSHNAWSLHNCNHGKDVGVACRSPPVRLVDGPHRYEGRLEIYHNGEWGVVCDDSINDKAARVVCRMLNFPGDMNLAQKYSGAHYGEGSLPMLPVDVSCNGSELRITDCSQKASVSYNCSHREYVGVACHPLSVRLVNGPHAFEGRLEVYNDGQWGTVCDDGFDNDAAKVVCRMLNFSGDVNLAEKYSAAHYGRGSLPILLDDVSCNGSELSITECSHNAWSLHNCNHGEDVGVACRSPSVRLVDGPHRHEGRLEIYHNGEWGVVCNDSINDNAASVVCRMLNFPGDMNLAQKYSAHYGEGSLPILPVDVSCNGSELRITDCSQKALGSYSCSHREYVGVACHPLPVRLVNGPHWYEGRLEIYHNGEWGTVCDDYFRDSAARVVCRMLNFPGDVNQAAHYSRAKYGEGSLPILLDDVICSGSELSITDCSHNAWGSHNCGHTEDVGVTCLRAPVRLVDGPHRHEGRLEIYHKGKWGAVCGDSFNDNAARVVCRMLIPTGYISLHRAQTLENNQNLGAQKYAAYTWSSTICHQNYDFAVMVV